MRFLILFLFIVLSDAAFAQSSAQVQFDKANALLESGNFEEALLAYQEIEKSGSVSGALFINMGYSAVQIDSLGLAKLYFLRALKFPVVSPDAEIALQYVNAQFSRQSATLPKLPWDKAVDWAKEGPGTSTIFIIGFLIFNLGIALILLNWFQNLNFPSFRLTLSLVFALGTLLTICAFYVDYIDSRYDEAVLIQDQANVYITPNSESELVSTAYEGYSVTIDNSMSENQSNWYYIRLGNGQYGWISNQSLIRL